MELNEIANPTREQILQSLYLSPEINAAIQKMDPEHLREDLRQEMFLALCDLPEERLLEMHAKKYLRFYLVRTMLNMIQSNRSTFAKTFRRIFIEFDKGGKAFSKDVNVENPAEEETRFIYSTFNAADHQLIKAQQMTSCLAPLEHRVGPAMAALHWYEEGMFKLYAENECSCRVVSEKTGIPIRSVRIAINAAKTKLKKALRT